MSKIPKQLLWILDYEDYLKYGVVMPLEAQRWVEMHKYQLDTPKKREMLMQFYAPSSGDHVIKKSNRKTTAKKSITRKRRKKRKDKGLALYMQFELSWETIKEMGITEKDQVQIMKNYRNKGLSLGAIEMVTKIKGEDLIAKVVPA